MPHPRRHGAGLRGARHGGAAVSGLPAALTALLALAACKREPPATSAKDAAPPPADAAVADVSVDDLLTGGAPTFVLGTAGDAAADHRIAVQVALLRDMALPRSRVVEDTAVDLEAWPASPVLYGRGDENAVVAALAGELPFRVTADRVEIGGEVFEGEGIRLIAAVPAAGRRPAFALFAGTGPAGVAEINAGLPLKNPILVADTFGPLVTGRWKRAGGKLVAELGPRQRRIAYRAVERKLAGVRGTSPPATVRFLFPEMVAARPDEAAEVDACMRGLARVVRRLDIAEPVPLSVYVYPDRGSKRSLTGNAGDGHAVPSSRALHLVAAPPEALERLVAHEGTHVLGYYAWGPAATPLLGEGLAVWVSGGYGGRTLAALEKAGLADVPIARLLGPGWGRVPEAKKYPLAGRVIEAAVAAVGAAAVRQHLLAATSKTWDAACKSAGTSASALEAAIRAP